MLGTILERESVRLERESKGEKKKRREYRKVVKIKEKSSKR